MSARSFARLASPTLMKNPATTRSILKRPAALPLSPSAFSASFSIHVSPSVTSPHVHFPTSTKLTSSFSTHSPNTYDRSAIAVSPNPLALPAYGDRIYSPISGVFKNQSLVNQSSESLDETFYTPMAEVTEFQLEAPPVPEVTKPTKAKQSRASIRFQQTLAAKKPALLPREDLGSALLKFPRSPYPTADTGKGNVPVTETRPRTAIGSESKELSSAVEAESAEDRLSQDFWRSVTLEEPHTKKDASPLFMFGTKDGALWSPGLPRRTPLEPVGLSSVLSPLSRTSFAKQANLQAILSPVPNDSFAAFPSFAAVLSMNAAEITYPPRAVVEH